MTYSLVGILAICVHVIINIGIFRKNGDSHFPAQRDYCYFLYSVIAYHATDALWGFLHEWRMPGLLYADTALYFVLMALSVLLWTTFVIRYLEREDLLDERSDKFGKALNYAGKGIFVFQILALAVNFVRPVLFFIDAEGEYHAEVTRYVAFALQMLMFLMTAIYTFIVSDAETDTMKRRHFTIGVFGVAMLFAIGIQLSYPLLPMYSIGYLLGGCLLHTFVVEDEKAEYLRALEESLNREAEHQRELGGKKHQAYTDQLTKVKSKHAYMESVEALNRRIMTRKVSEFATVVFDVNGLRHVNDADGHKAGDQCIFTASQTICDVFKHSPIFRIGGDEFSAILEGKDYESRDALMKAFDRMMEENLRKEQVTVSAGLAEYDPEEDETFNAVFERANEKLYERKRFFKEREARSKK